MIVRMLTLGAFGTNCYVVGSEKTGDGMVVDPADEAAVILDTARKLGLTVRLIVLTHAHMDHVAALAEVKEATGAKLLVHADEAPSLQAGPNRMMQMMGLRGRSAPPPDRLLNDGDVLEVGDLSFKVLHTPGHTPGGISLYGEGVVFTGDTLFNSSIGRTDFNPNPDESYNQLIRSIETKLMALPDEIVVLPGHMGESTIGQERRYNPFL